MNAWGGVKVSDHLRKAQWSADIDLDNNVLIRHVVKSPPDGKPRADFSKLNAVRFAVVQYHLKR